MLDHPSSLLSLRPNGHGSPTACRPPANDNGAARNPRRRPSRAEAETAVRTLIAWAGDDPKREGLIDTPARVVRAYEEFFSGYDEDPEQHLTRTFEEVGGYREMVSVLGIPVETHCEHHMVRFAGVAHVAYLPQGRVVGLSKLARVVAGFSRRLQIQERLTVEIAEAIDRVLRPAGTAVFLEAEHQCMSTRGVRAHGTSTVTMQLTGAFRDDLRRREEFLALARRGH